MARVSGEAQTARFTCPICGRPGTLLVRRRGSREYLYVRHYSPRSECYIGPAGEYKHVNALYARALASDPELRGLAEADLLSSALNLLRAWASRALAQPLASGAAAAELRKLEEIEELARSLRLRLAGNVAGSRAVPTPYKDSI
ncbi:MAG: hypothetical protein ABWK00_01415 [Desulfurococcaceae archaeon]